MMYEQVSPLSQCHAGNMGLVVEICRQGRELLWQDVISGGQDDLNIFIRQRRYASMQNDYGISPGDLRPVSWDSRYKPKRQAFPGSER